jgi:hypothetical protein
MVEMKLRDKLGSSWALTTFEAVVIVALLFSFCFGPEALP